MRRVRSLAMLAVAGMLIMPGGRATAADATVTVESAREIASAIGEDAPWVSTLSPSGAMLAYYLDGGRRDEPSRLCVYTFQTAGKVCHPLPDAFEYYPYDLAWSPDETAIAFSENPVEMSRESDIWLLDVASGAYTDLTDDGVTGSRQVDDGAVPNALDYLPSWSPAGDAIVFWRGAIRDEGGIDLALMSVPRAGGEATLVRDLRADAPSGVPVFLQERFFLDGPTALSPDGTTMAALVTAVDDMGVDTTDLWLIGLAAGSTASMVASQADLAAAIPEWQIMPATPLGVSWMADGSGLVVLTTVDDIHSPMVVVHHVDVATGTLTPVVDFSSVASSEAYWSEPAPDGQLPWRLYSPWSASLSPAGDRLLLVNDLGGTIALMEAALPPDGSLPVVAAASESPFAATEARSSRSADGKVTIEGLLLSITES